MAERTLPISAAHREFTVKVGGRAVARSYPLMSASVVSRVDRIASARLVYSDGEAATGKFALADGTTFPPGAAVEILAGAAGAEALLFRGIVVRIGVRVRENAATQFVVDCRHATGKLTLARHGANYFDALDSEVIEQLLGRADVDAEVEATRVRHAQLVQHDVNDWDFLVARAQANGLAVFTRGDKVVVRRPSSTGAAVATLQFGATLLDFDVETDARIHAQSVHTLSWDQAEQAVQDVEAADAGFAVAGNLRSDDLAAGVGVERFESRHGTLAQDEAQTLGDALRLRARVDQASGRAKCIGLPQVQPGDVVELAGVGDRFRGKVLVTGVSHEMEATLGFRTQVQFGSVAQDPALAQRLTTPRHTALLAATAGVQCGVVTSLEDPASEGRIRVRCPLVDAGDDGVWARVASLDAGGRRGFQFLPELGDEVVVAFIDDDPRQPIVLGMLHSSAHPPPFPSADENHVKGYVSRSGIELRFDDESTIVTLSTPGGRSIVMDDAAGEVKLQDGNGNKIVLDANGITIESAAALTLKAGTDGTVEAGTSLRVAAKAELALEGSGSAELRGGATTKITGGVVQIN